ncbi:MAG: sugar ABC transporter permease [Clostridia bacterium]|nr:sugar ABC transporter permease [Clostridia bacterium]
MKTKNGALMLDKNVKKRGVIDNLVQHRYAYILLLPAIISVILFLYLPMFGLIIAFKDYNIIDGLWGSDWVGLENFKVVFQHRTMMKAVVNTLVLNFLNIFGGLPFPIILAILFNEIWSTKFKKTVQTLSYLPHFLSWVSVVGFCYSILAIEGPINHLLAYLLGEGYEAKNFLMDSKYFLPIAFITALWKEIGWNSVIYLAAITGIDSSLYEAATIDGANKLQQTWHITLASIKSTVVVLLVMKLGTLFSGNFELVYGLQNVFTIDDTETIGTMVYRAGIQNGDYSTATAFGVMQGVISVILILSSNFLSKKVAEVSIW